MADDDEVEGEIVEDEDGDWESYRFELEMNVNDDLTLNISLSGVPKEHIKYMFSTTIADVITTTLMDMEMKALLGIEDDEEESICWCGKPATGWGVCNDHWEDEESDDDA